MLCLGAGGAGIDIAAHLLGQPERPARIVVTSRRAEPLEVLTSVGRELGARDILDPRVVADATQSDALLASMAPGSIIVNATGAGKDRPGSPISGAVPSVAVVMSGYRASLMPRNFVNLFGILSWRGKLEQLDAPTPRRMPR